MPVALTGTYRSRTRYHSRNRTIAVRPGHDPPWRRRISVSTAGAGERSQPYAKMVLTLMTARMLPNHRATLVLSSCALIAMSCRDSQPAPRPQETVQRADTAQPVAKDAAPRPIADGRPAGPPPRITQLVLADRHTCALTEVGTVRCWGKGDNGRLGHSNTASIGDNEPVWTAGDVPLGGPATQLAAGSRHTCALMREKGAVRCWGGNQHGQLGYAHRDDIGDNETPASAGDIQLGGSAVQLAAGGSITCVVLDSGLVRCWGYGREGGLGRGKMPDLNIGDDEHPATNPTLDIGVRVTGLALTRNAGCALLESSDVRCWGYQPGRPDSVQRKPSEVGDVRIGAPVQRLSASGSITCALLTSAGVRCFGEHGKAALGYPGRDTVGLDDDLAGLGDIEVGGQVVDLGVGANHVCAVLRGGSVRCWGANSTGQLGRGDKLMIGDDETPASAPSVDVGGPVSHIAAGGSATCALLESGGVRCWGYNRDGQLGYGHTDTIGDDETPASVGDVALFATTQ